VRQIFTTGVRVPEIEEDFIHLGVNDEGRHFYLSKDIFDSMLSRRGTLKDKQLLFQEIDQNNFTHDDLLEMWFSSTNKDVIHLDATELEEFLDIYQQRKSPLTMFVLGLNDVDKFLEEHGNKTLIEIAGLEDLGQDLSKSTMGETLLLNSLADFIEKGRKQNG